MTSNLLKSVLSVLSFYEIFEYPLTEDEIWQNLLFYKEDENLALYERKDLASILQDLVDRQVIFQRNALYGIFPLNEDLFYLDKRRSFYLHYYLKLKKAKRWAKRLACFPGVRMVALVNSVAMKMPKADSDLDFFIITDKKSLWISRFIITSFLKLFGLRPNFVDDNDTICTSFWLSEAQLNLAGIKSRYFDVYLFNWLYNIIPLYDAANYYEKLQKANQWKKRFLAMGQDVAYGPLLQKLSWPARLVKSFGEFIFLRKFWHRFLKKWQMQHFPENIKKMMNQDSRVMVNDYVLKFHTVDNREKYWEKYKENFDKLLNEYRYASKS